MNKRPHPLDNIFDQYEPQFDERGYPGIPVAHGTKKPCVKGWTRSGVPPEKREAWRRRFPNANIGLLAGPLLSSGRHFAFLDIDLPALVPFVSAVVPLVSGKAGAKGLTIFCQADAGLKSVKLLPPNGGAPALEIFLTSRMTVVPPSLHPTGIHYQWRGKSLLEIEHDELPILDQGRLELLVFSRTRIHGKSSIAAPI